MTPPAPPEPVTPVQSPSIQRKRVLTSPASDLSSPEHQRRAVDVPPRPRAPETRAEPMGVKLAIEGVSANFALKHTVSPADLCECKG